jgi:hypothetical protein
MTETTEATDAECAALCEAHCPHFDDITHSLNAEIKRLRSMIAGWANGYTPACNAIVREASLIREAGNDGRGISYE